MDQALQARNETFKLKPQLARDSYKLGHDSQYPLDTQKVYTNMTFRSAKHFKAPAVCGFDNKITWVGLQGTMMEYRAMWQEQFFSRPWDEVETEYVNRTTPFMGKAPDTSRLKALHDLRYLPLHVKQIPEGSYLNIGVPAFTIVNTQPNENLFGWLTNATETYLSNESWKLPTIATIATAYRRLFDHYAELTGGSMEFVDWQGHCFADRGQSGYMDAAKNCSGHSVAFLGSDSVSSADWITWAYFAEENFIAGSVPASEHAVSSLNIAVIKAEMKKEIEAIHANLKEGEEAKDLTEDELMAEAEYRFCKRYITEVYPTGVASYVADTYNFWRVITEIAARLKEEILARQPDANGLAKVVFRPDSGDPVKVLTGYVCAELPAGATQEDFRKLSSDVEAVKLHDGTYYEVGGWLTSSNGDRSGLMLGRKLSEPEVKGAVECLWDIFGGTVTDKGFKQLHERVSLIYGDSITPDRADQIMRRLMAKGFASTNWVAGIGSYTYQYITRDTFGAALKATNAEVAGVAHEIYKDPITDPGKKSAKGLLRVEYENGNFVLYDQQTPEQEKQGVLQDLFLNGKFHNLVNWKTVRERFGLVKLNV
jgi:nicotinamide phosphoribosyltransferase